MRHRRNAWRSHALRTRSISVERGIAVLHKNPMEAVAAFARRVCRDLLDPSPRIMLQVCGGTAYLDRVMPDWHERVELSRLHAGSPRECVLAQITRTPFEETCALLGLDQTRAYYLGFLPLPWVTHKYTRAWRQEVRQRQEREAYL
jgi:hypothetical protein